MAVVRQFQTFQVLKKRNSSTSNFLGRVSIWSMLNKYVILSAHMLIVSVACFCSGAWYYSRYDRPDVSSQVGYLRCCEILGHYVAQINHFRFNLLAFNEPYLLFIKLYFPPYLLDYQYALLVDLLLIPMFIQAFPTHLVVATFFPACI